MLKYCFILDEIKGTVQLGAGCSDTYYEEIGMKKRNVEQSDKDNLWYLAEKCPHKTDEEKLQDAKTAKSQENSTKRDAVNRIKANFSETASGYLLKSTPVGDIMTVVMGLALPAMMAQQAIPAGSMRYYDENNEPHLTPEIAADYVSTFYQGFAQNIAKIDTYSTIIEVKIQAATTIEEVNAIVIDYNNMYTANLEEVEEIDYTKFTVAQLKAMADEKGITYPSNILKADLIALLQNAE